MEIVRQTLSHQVRQRLGQWLDQGKFQPGERLEELRLCERLNVSRTPLREALRQLEQDGLLVSRPHAGYSVVKPDARMVRELFPVIGALEALALRGSTLTDTQLDALHGYIEALRTASSPSARYAADHAFHAELLSGCNNQTLREEIARLHHRARLCDGGESRGVANVALTLNQHSAMLAALRTRDQASAAALLEQHWLDGIDTVLGWIEQRP